MRSTTPARLERCRHVHGEAPPGYGWEAVSPSGEVFPLEMVYAAGWTPLILHLQGWRCRPIEGSK